MLKNKRFLLGVIISAVFLALFFLNVDFKKMGQALANANYIYLIPALVVYFLGVWFRAIRWFFLLRPLGSFKVWYLFRLVVIGFTLNNLVPGRLGIILRAYMLGEREKVSKVAVGATVGVERIFDGLAMVLILMLTSFFVTLQEGEVSVWIDVVKWGSLGMFLLFLLGLLVITFKPGVFRKIGIAVIRRLPSRSKLKWDEWLDAAIAGLSLPRQKGRLIAVSVTSLFVWICEGSMFYVISLGFDIGQPYHAMLFVMCIATLSWFVLVAPGGLGTFDWFGQKTLQSLGVGTNVASAVILAIHAALLLPVIALGFLFLWLENLSFAEIIGGKRRLSLESDTREAKH